MSDCLELYAVVKEQCYATRGPLRDIEWHMPTNLDNFTSSQGELPTVPPARTLANDLDGGGQRGCPDRC